jgi:hypothetical protein
VLEQTNASHVLHINRQAKPVGGQESEKVTIWPKTVDFGGIKSRAIAIALAGILPEIERYNDAAIRRDSHLTKEPEAWRGSDPPNVTTR